MESILFDIAKLPFDGNVATGQVRGSGPRRSYIVDALKGGGLTPTMDEYGNVWVECGTIGEYRLCSSHMDVDATKGDRNLRIERSGDTFRGILDNAVGCYLNMLAAQSHKSGQRTLYVFTASEEEESGHPENKSRSAKDVVKVLSRKGVQPELCVALDVTYPRLIVPAGELEARWDEPFGALFDVNDKTHCYIDGLMRPDSRQLAEQLLKIYANPKIGIRDLTDWDESAVYSSVAPALAFGPVAFGKFDEPEQVVPAVNAETALDFLKFILTQSPQRL